MNTSPYVSVLALSEYYEPKRRFSKHGVPFEAGETGAAPPGERWSAAMEETQAGGQGRFRRRDEGLSEDGPPNLLSRDREQSARQGPGGGGFRVGEE